jgi:shikimate kinase
VHTVVFLTGFMGAGKTSVGRALAARLGWRFVDLDDRIITVAGCSIADLFREAGEPAFRRAETQALSMLLVELRQAPGAIIALGGGAFVQAANARLLQEFGAPVVFLDAPAEELRRRCRHMAGSRPLYADENQFRQLYEARRSGYMKAGLRVETVEKTVGQVAAEVAQRLGLGESYDTAPK